MSWIKVQELRSKGDLDGAYNMATIDFNNDPNNIWAKRSLAWCIYSQLKENNKYENRILFFEKLRELSKIDLPSDESMITNNVIFLINKFIYNIYSTKKVSSKLCDNLFESINTITFDKPSDIYSSLFKYFLYLKNEWDNFGCMCKWWGFENFQSKDYSIPEGSSLSLVERAIIAYSKSILNNIESTPTDTLNNFIKFLNNLIINHTEYKYALYFKAKLLSATGKKDEAINTIIPFLKKMINEFWVWDFLGDNTSNPDLKFSCYARAICCKSKEEMLIKVKEKFLFILIQHKEYDLAKSICNEVIQTRTKNSWNISNDLRKIVNSSWFNTSSPINDIKRYLTKFTEAANEFIYHDTPQHPILITYINKDKQIANFITKNKKSGFFNYNKFSKQSKIECNSTYYIRTDNIEENKPTIIISLIETEDNIDELVIKFQGILKKNIKGFGFINDIFIPQPLLSNFNNGDNISGKAVLSYNKSKDSWGWKATYTQTPRSNR